MILYKAIKTVISGGNYNKEDMQAKIDLFYLKNRLTQEEYDELSEIIKNGATANEN